MKYSESEYTWQALEALREHTRTAGVLSELQVLQLQTWPQIVFPNRRVRLSWNCPLRVVDYVVSGAGLPASDDSPRYCGFLDRNIKAMLGDDWEVVIRDQGGNLIYKGERLTPYVPPAGAGASLTAPPPRGDNADDVRIRNTEATAGPGETPER